MIEPFQHTIQIGWGDLDANGHMRNSAYLDAAANVRMIYFASQGFTAAKLADLGIGPIALSDTLSYRRELTVPGSISPGGTAPDRRRSFGRRWPRPFQLLHL